MLQGKREEVSGHGVHHVHEAVGVGEQLMLYW